MAPPLSMPTLGPAVGRSSRRVRAGRRCWQGHYYVLRKANDGADKDTFGKLRRFARHESFPICSLGH